MCPRAPLVPEPASLRDLSALVALEERAFAEDRISRAAWRRLLTRAHGQVLVARGAAGEPALLGAAVVLFREGTEVARLYSLAVDPTARGRGVGRALLEAVEAAARREGRRRLRLEVRDDNRAALALYADAGFRPVERLPEYYAGGGDGLRMELRL